MTHADLLELCKLSSASSHRGELAGMTRGLVVAHAATVHGPNTPDGRPREVKVTVWCAPRRAPKSIHIMKAAFAHELMEAESFWWHEIPQAARDWLLALDWVVHDPIHPLIQLAHQAESTDAST